MFAYRASRVWFGVSWTGFDDEVCQLHCLSDVWAGFVLWAGFVFRDGFGLGVWALGLGIMRAGTALVLMGLVRCAEVSCVKDQSSDCST